MREANKLSATLAEFDRTILPTYERWEREHLAPLLDEERRLAVKIDELEHLIHKASLESLFTGGDPYEIFARAQKELEKQRPTSATDSDFEGEASDDFSEAHGDSDDETDEAAKAEAHLSEEERDFRSYVRFMSGEDPDSFSSREYTRLFREYRRWREKMGATRASSQRKTTDIPARIKEIYRVLVRRLHPDAGKANPDPHIERLWHDLQEAYAAMDLERMEVLLAITDLHESGDAMRSSLYHLRKVAKEMASNIRKLKARFREVSTSEAWVFWHAKDRDKAGEKIRTAIVSRIQESQEYISALEKDIDDWKKDSEEERASAQPKQVRPAKAPPVFGEAPPRKKSGPASNKQAPSPHQRDFDF